MTESSNTIYIGKHSQFTQDSRFLVKHGARNIAVIAYKSKFYAVDNACYHHGGPLLMGDIEDVGGQRCLVCPWHKYFISLETGEGLYYGIDFPLAPTAVAGAIVRDPALSGGGIEPTQTVKSKGCKQRVHQVEVRGEDVFLIVNDDPRPLESDTYATMEIANREAATPAPVHRMGPSAVRSSGQIHSSMHRTRAVDERKHHRSRDAAWYRHCPRAGVNPLHAGSSPHISPDGSAFFEDLYISVKKVVDLCDDTREIFFSRKSGLMKRHMELGETIVVEPGNNHGQNLRLVITGADEAGYSTMVRLNEERKDGAQEANRKFRVTKASTLNPLDPRDWMYEYSLYSVLRVITIGGSFTLVDHMQEIRQLEGRVLWLSAGMGICNAYAALQTRFDHLTNESERAVRYQEDALTVVHIHVERCVKRIPKLDVLLKWSTHHSASSSTSALESERKRARRQDEQEGTPLCDDIPLFTARPSNSSYLFHAFLTHEDTPPAATAPEFSDSSLPGIPISLAPLPPIAASGVSNAEVNLEVPPKFVYNRRPEREDVQRILAAYFGVKPVLAYVSGPASFVEAQTHALSALGVPQNYIITETM